MEARLLWASLWRRRGTAALAALAVAIGASVAAALLHVSGDVGSKLTRELRALGPNLLVTPSAAAPGAFLDEALVRGRLAAAGVHGVPLLYGRALARGHAVVIAGADPAALAQLHPSWQRAGGLGDAQAGAALAKRFGLEPGDPLVLTSPDGARTLDVRIGGVFDSGGSDDEALWLPLAQAQAFLALPGRVSLAQARVEGGSAGVERAAARLQQGGGLAALPLHALSATEQGLLDRMRRLMLLVTLAALVAGALSAYGTLTDLALERRREIALLKAIGAPRRRIIGRFLAESVAIGLTGGIVGWAIGAGFALFIGRLVFHATLRLQPGVPPIVIALAVGIALLAAAGPIRLALAVEPARALREDG
jgi:putative ABC transport system permease protein